jgi:serine/threonine-protein kinase
VTLFDFGVCADGQYKTLEFVQGGTLRKFFKAAPSGEAIRRVLCGICDGLSYAHGHNVIHRDIKPSNILVSDEDLNAKILDFGLARMLEDAKASLSGVLGTPSYMSPEQVLGGEVSHSTDIYSLGVTLFDVLTGELPFKGADLGHLHVHVPPPAPRSVNPALSEDLEAILLRCLEKKPEDRFPHARAVGDALRKAKI